jgi:hypothetical protein
MGMGIIAFAFPDVTGMLAAVGGMIVRGVVFVAAIAVLVLGLSAMVLMGLFGREVPRHRQRRDHCQRRQRN